MRGDDVFDVDTAVEILVGLDVCVVVGGSNVVPIVGLGEEPRRPEDDDRKTVVPGDELTLILRRGLRHAVDVPRDRNDVFGDPCRRLARERRQRPAEGARGAREDEAADTGRDRFLQQGQRSRDVRLDERLPVMRADVRLVQRCRVEDGSDAREAVPDGVTVGDRADNRRERRRKHIEADDLAPLGAQDTHECLTEMPGGAGDKNLSSFTRMTIARTVRAAAEDR